MHLNPKGQVCSLKTPFYPLLLFVEKLAKTFKKDISRNM